MISFSLHGKCLGLLLSPFTDEETESSNPGHPGSKTYAVFLMQLSLSLVPLKYLTGLYSCSIQPMCSPKEHLLIHSTSICWVHSKHQAKGWVGPGTVGRLTPQLPCQLSSIWGVLQGTMLTGPGGTQGPVAQ